MAVGSSRQGAGKQVDDTVGLYCCTIQIQHVFMFCPTSKKVTHEIQNYSYRKVIPGAGYRCMDPWSWKLLLLLLGM